MQLDLKETVAGQPIKAVRDLLRGVYDGFHLDYITHRLPKCNSDTMIAELLKRRWVSPGRDSYIVTAEGRRVACARLKPPFPRAKGEAILVALRERIASVNSNPNLCFYVKELRLFGSMLDNSIAVVGDVDVAFDLAQRRGRNGYPEWSKWERARADASGRYPWTYFGYGEKEVMRLLKCGVSGLSLHSVFELDGLKTRSKRLPVPPPTPPSIGSVIGAEWRLRGEKNNGH